MSLVCSQLGPGRISDELVRPKSYLVKSIPREQSAIKVGNETVHIRLQKKSSLVLTSSSYLYRLQPGYPHSVNLLKLREKRLDYSGQSYS